MPFPRRNILPVCALSLFCAAHAFAQSSSSVAVPPDSSVSSSSVSSSSVSISSAALSAPPASSAAPVKMPRPLRSVLYLSGGENSPWFYLGVLYAVRDYRIPVDSVSGTSWGAWIGSLWTSGWNLDDIQRLLTEGDVAPYLSEDALSPSEKESRITSLPIAPAGNSALEMRFSLAVDTAGYASLRSRPLVPDTAALRYSLFKLRVQESLDRASAGAVVPFAASLCGKSLSGSPSDVLRTLPFRGNASAGDFCGIVPDVPADSSMFAIVATPFPVRNAERNTDPWRSAVIDASLSRLQEMPSPGVVIRPHSLMNLKTPADWMKAGYKEVEARMGDFLPVMNRPRIYVASKDTLYPRFRYAPSFDSLPSEVYSHVAALWNSADTGFAAPENFARRLLSTPLYDSLQMNLERDGSLSVIARESPILEVKAGGFGSNVTGANAYGNILFNYVNQFEYRLSATGFAGENSYGFSPEMQLRGMWQGNWNFYVRGDFAKYEPLRGYFSDEPAELRIYREKRSDASLGLDYALDSIRNIGVKVTVGNGKFVTELSSVYGEMETRSLAPDLVYTECSAGYVPWFGSSGHSISGNAGFRSVNLAVNGITSAPLYFSSSVDAGAFVSPWRYLTFGGGAAGGVNIRRESGYGYEYPEKFSVSDDEEEYAIGNRYRLHEHPTPWSEEWNFTDLSSHHYGLVRASIGLHSEYFGAWIFGAYIRDFEDNPTIDLGVNRLIMEPTLRAAYKSLEVRAGMSRLTDVDNVSDFKDFKNYRYFVKIGSFQFGS